MVIIIIISHSQIKILLVTNGLLVWAQLYDLAPVLQILIQILNFSVRNGSTEITCANVCQIKALNNSKTIIPFPKY